jgi:hypothetical protein
MALAHSRPLARYLKAVANETHNRPAEKSKA